MGFHTGLLLLQVALSPVELERLDAYSAAWADRNTANAVVDRARAEFANRGVDLADAFLRHTGPRPRNDAYFFVLRTVADVQTALTLLRAFPAPPAHESGLLDRHFGEIAVALEAVLTNDTVRADPRVGAAVQEVIAIARRKPYGTGMPEAVTAIGLLGKCTSADAALILRRLSSDVDAVIRVAATDALGQLARGVDAPGAQASLAGDVLRTLISDPSPSARQQAAISLGAIHASDVLAGLRAALRLEQDPRVVDAIVQALHRLGSPVRNPDECRPLIGRTWETSISQRMLECWDPDMTRHTDLIEMALTGLATQRATALLALSTPRARGLPVSLIDTGAPDPAQFDRSTQERLLESAVWVLSQQDAISGSTRDATAQALWNLSRRNMQTSLEYLDRVTPVSARFHASSAMDRTNTTGYNAIRRWQHSAVALTIALAFALVGALRASMRRPAVLIAISAIGLAAWSWQTSGVRNLPPPPLQLITFAAIGFLSAGAATAAAALVPNPSTAGRRFGAVRVTATVIAAGVMGLTLCAITRITKLFPSDQGGWETIFDPLGSAMLAIPVATLLIVVDHVSFRSTRPG